MIPARSQHSLPLSQMTLPKIHPRSPRPALIVSILAAAVLLSPSQAAPAEGFDFELGGSGDQPGQFADLRDIAFDGQGQLITLEGQKLTRDRDHEYPGNQRVQKFDAAGKPLSSFSLADPAFPEKPIAGHPHGPAHLAGDAQGNVFVTYPGLNLARKYGPAGAKLADFTISSANAVVRYPARGPACVAVIGGVKQVVGRNWAEDGGKEITLIDGEKTAVIPLEREMVGVADMAADQAGNFYVLASLNALYKFSPEGKLLKSIGAQTKSRPNDGSELNLSVDVDAEGNIYALENSLLCRFSADLQTVSTHEPKYKWFQNANFKAIALDGQGRLWGATPDLTNSSLFERYHFLPTVARLTPDFLNPQTKGVASASTLALGLKPTIEPALPFGIAYDLQPFAADLVIAPANRNVQKLDVEYHVYDAYRREAGRGRFALDLKDGEEARAPMPFTPPRFGWYTYEVTVTGGGRELFRIGHHVGVTPDFVDPPKLTKVEGLSGTNDAQKQAFVGLPNMRLNATADPKSLEALEKALSACEQFQTVPFVAFSDEKDVTEASVRAAVMRFKGRVKVWEIVNEPNLRMPPEKYVSDYLAPAARIIHEVDPAAKVMGPTVCGVNLPWCEGFYQAGGGKLADIISIHDYEGHEALDPIHWRWKIGELRKIMAQHGDEKKELWQTERVFGAIRGGDFMPLYQAVNMAQHRDLLETLGIEQYHNNHYYVNQMGYQSVPSYIYGTNGFHAAALVMRTRYAQTLAHTYAGTLDFGRTGNQILSGLRFIQEGYETIVLRNEGTTDQTVKLKVSGEETPKGDVEVMDAWGNVSKAPVRNGLIEVTASQLPTYIISILNGKFEPAEQLDFGQNLAELATFTYSGHTDRPMSLLNNGIIEVIHAGHPDGGTDGKKIWSGDLPEIDGQIVPQTLEFDFGTPRTFDKIVLHGLRGDNAFCTLLDYDLQVSVSDGTWLTLAVARSSVPPSDVVSLPPTLATQWNGNENLFIHQFAAPVTAQRVRLIARRATYGFAFDRIAAEATQKAWGGTSKPRLMLREVEVFAPASPLKIEVTAPQPRKNGLFAPEDATVTLTNQSAKAIKTTAKIKAPIGWKVEPAEVPVEVAPGATQTFSVRVTPQTVLAIGPAFVEVTASVEADQPPSLGWLRYEIVSPLELTPGIVREIGTPQQSLTATLSNTSAAPISGTVGLAVGSLTFAQPFGPVEPGKTAEVSFLVPALAVTSGHVLANYLATFNGLLVTATQRLGVRLWNVIGTWEKDLDQKFGPEKDLAKGIDPARNFTDAMGNEQKWRIIASEPSGYLNMLSLQPHENITAYALIYVTSPTVRRAIFSAGTDDGGKAWLNGQEIFVDPKAHDSAPGQVQKPVELKAGRNEVLYKIVQGKFNMGLHFDLLDAVGKPMTDLAFAPRP